MLAAEQTNRFTYKVATSTTDEMGESTTESLTERLQDLDIGKIVSSSTGKSDLPEKIMKTTSSSRPLTVDEDDLDLDLEIDDTIDTTVSPLCYYQYVFLLFVFLFSCNFLLSCACCPYISASTYTK